MAEERRRLTVGILAHVDAGKTTLSESMLYLSGRIRTQGRVDNGNTFLDTAPMERERGITIYSKQARLSVGDLDIVLLDTPGHVDFSAETERTLGVLDYAILVVSGTDGVQNHTLTLWQLLRTYRVPTFIFVNKMDLPTPEPAVLESAFRARLDPACCAVLPGEDAAAGYERMAEVNEALLDAFLEDGTLTDGQIASEIAGRRLFPCFFGAALRNRGVTEFLEAFARLTLPPPRGESFGARVFKIARDDGQRFTYMKITGGKLTVREEITYPGEDGKPHTEKAAQIRLYSGEKFTPAQEVRAGDVCTVLGLSATYAGLGLGAEPDGTRPVLEPVLTYRLKLPEGCDVNQFFPKLKQLEEEDPALHLVWEERLGEIHARLMGEVQTDVLRRTVRDRFGIEVEVDAGKILYKETLAHAAEGVGHYEPLRHYAEVHLLLEPLPRGCGLVFDTRCTQGQLDRNWQRLVLTHLGEKTHLGVLTGSPLTDVKITLVNGRSHVKHTEGGDFREATYRAVRQGLMQVPSVLLEPIYRYELDVPADCTGRAINDLQTRSASFALETTEDGGARITGRGPVSELRDYAREVAAYSHGAGRFFCTPDGYEPCHNAEAVIAERGYSPTADLENTPDSVFCAHGAGYVVPWDAVREKMHVSSGYSADGLRSPKGATLADLTETIPLRSPRAMARDFGLSDRELEKIMEREFGPIRRPQYSEKHTVEAEKKKTKEQTPKRPLLIIDGYNLIFQWDYLAAIAEDSLEHAREVLMDLLGNYSAFTDTELILVFDAYRVKDAPTRETVHDGVRVVYTAENETGDAYIEKLIYELGASFSVRVVTSDRLIQFSAVNVGVMRMSAREFAEEIQRVNAEITAFIGKLAKNQE